MLQKPADILTDAQTQEALVIANSGKFDLDWYYEVNPDVFIHNWDGVVHYVKYGAAEGRRPNRDFDAEKYLKLKAAEIKRGQNPFAHFILYGSNDDLFDRGMMAAFSVQSLQNGIQRLSRFPLYSDEAYRELNSALPSETIYKNHAFLYGFAEGRSIFSKETVSRELGNVSCIPFSPLEVEGIPSKIPSLVGVYFNSEGNGFLKEIAGDLVEALISVGINSRLLDENSDIEDRPSTCIFVAPHEFFHLGRGRDWVSDDVISKSIMFNTEQPQTIWFERGVPFILMSRGVIDISSQTCALFAATGMPTISFNPNVSSTGSWLQEKDSKHPMVRVLPPQARKTPRIETLLEERPIDISFFGGSSTHRDNFFVRHAGFLADYNCYLYYRKFNGPLTNSTRDGVLSRLASHVTAHSKISLNIHRDDYGFFEWHRIVKQAMGGGSVVVTEPCLPHPLFKPGIHFFEECGRHIPNLIDWLLKSTDGIAQAEKVRQTALALVFDPTVASRNGAVLKQFISNYVENI
jgi:hypothetical protein